MRTRLFVLLIIGAGTMTLGATAHSSAGDDDAEGCLPEISSVLPSPVIAGDGVEVSGACLGNVGDTITLNFDGAQKVTHIDTDGVIRFTMPVKTDVSTVELTTAGGQVVVIPLIVQPYHLPGAGDAVAPGKILVKVREEGDEQRLSGAGAAASGPLFDGASDLDLSRWFFVDVPSGQEVQYIEAIADESYVEWVEPLLANGGGPDLAPNDPWLRESRPSVLR
ncbi:MAG: hypothetical protein WD904_08180 [Dehalococcoidia bacterium]